MRKDDTQASCLLEKCYYRKEKKNYFHSLPLENFPVELLHMQHTLISRESENSYGKMHNSETKKV